MQGQRDRDSKRNAGRKGENRGTEKKKKKLENTTKTRMQINTHSRSEIWHIGGNMVQGRKYMHVNVSEGSCRALMTARSCS